MKTYVCECGKEFDNPQKANGHKQGCKTHIILKYGSLEAYYKIKTRNCKQAGKTQHNIAVAKKEAELAQWISEQHTCEKCGKVMTEKYGSGRFCSKGCANKRQHSQETIDKISSSNLNSDLLKQQGLKIHLECEEKYSLSPKLCCICGLPISYNRRERQTCSSACTKELQRSNRIKMMAKIGSNTQRAHFGFYHGIECDSSWELAFLLYHLDNNSNIIRNFDGFNYIDHLGVSRKYYLDFIIDGEYYEIKGEYNEDVPLKLKYFPVDKTIYLLDRPKIKSYLKYAKETYGKNFDTLYDKDRRSWFNRDIE